MMQPKKSKHEALNSPLSIHNYGIQPSFTTHLMYNFINYEKHQNSYKKELIIVDACDKIWKGKGFSIISIMITGDGLENSINQTVKSEFTNLIPNQATSISSD